MRRRGLTLPHFTPSPCSSPGALLTSSSFILMSFSVSASGVGSGRMGMGLSMRLSWVSLLCSRPEGGNLSDTHH